MTAGTWKIIEREDYAQVKPLVREATADEAYLTLHADACDEECMAYWFSPQGKVYAYQEDEEPVGIFYLRPNQFRLGAHVANAGYVVAKKASGRGIGRKLGEKSIEEARNLGFKALQFNFVVSTNEKAVHLWKSLGFAIIGTVPEGYWLKQERYVDAYIMYRKL